MLTTTSIVRKSYSHYKTDEIFAQNYLGHNELMFLSVFKPPNILHIHIHLQLEFFFFILLLRSSISEDISTVDDFVVIAKIFMHICKHTVHNNVKRTKRTNIHKHKFKFKLCQNFLIQCYAEAL